MGMVGNDKTMTETRAGSRQETTSKVPEWATSIILLMVDMFARQL